MNHELVARWITALKSGQYEQGRSALKKDNQYCCLGVLCDLLPDEGHFESTSDRLWSTFVTTAGETETGLLPQSILTVVGMTSHEQSLLVALNDADFTFGEIAALLEPDVWPKVKPLYDEIMLVTTEPVEPAVPRFDHFVLQLREKLLALVTPTEETAQ